MMIPVINRNNVFSSLALLIFSAILVFMAFSRPLAAFAGNEPMMNRQDTEAGPRAIRTQLAPGNALTSLTPPPIYLPIIVGGARGAGGLPTPTPTQTAIPTTPPGTEGALFLNRTKRTDSASAAVDAAGGFHIAYVAFVPFAEGTPAYYAYCAANCATVSSWGTVSFSDRIVEVQLALTKTGHPRLLLRGDNYDTQFFQYAACDVNCTYLASWTIADVTTSTYSPVYENSYSGHHYFALDNLDRPRFLYRKTIADAYYAYCDIDCTSTVTGNWYEYPINPAIFSDSTNLPTLTFTTAGQPRITAVIMGNPGSKDYLTYIACDTVCINQASWTYTALMERGSGHVSSVLRFNSNGQPRLVFNQGSFNSGPAGYLWYWWCNSGCTDGTHWAGSSVGAQGQAEDPDLALDALNRPRIAFRSNSPDDGLGYAWCDTSCESGSATWQGGLVEPSSDLDVEWPILPGVGCSPTASYWYGGYRPSLALDTAGNPRIGYVAQHLVQTGSSCSSYEDMRAVRFVFFNKP
jgi:hypothetical protein